jgi:hypothetical protein
MLQVIQHLVGTHLAYCSPYDVSVIKCVEMVYEMHDSYTKGEGSKEKGSVLLAMLPMSDKQRVVQELEKLMAAWEQQTEYVKRRSKREK